MNSERICCSECLDLRNFLVPLSTGVTRCVCVCVFCTRVADDIEIAHRAFRLCRKNRALLFEGAFPKLCSENIVLSLLDHFDLNLHHHPLLLPHNLSVIEQQNEKQSLDGFNNTPIPARPLATRSQSLSTKRTRPSDTAPGPSNDTSTPCWDKRVDSHKHALP